LSSCRTFGWAVVASTILATVVGAPLCADDGGGLVGWVESTRGVPVAGAIVSIFGKGIRGGSLVTLADSQGQFVLSSLPPGSYTLRAIGFGHEPSAARHVTVLPNRDLLYTLSLTPVGDAAAAADEAVASASDPAESQGSEWRWLVRHKRRSVLETSGPELPAQADDPSLAAPAPAALDTFDGSMQLAATAGSGTLPDAGSTALPGSMGSLQLEGRFANGVHWALGGLMSENEGRAWRVAAQFVLEPGGGHQVELGAGYGAGDSRTVLANAMPEPDRAVGALFARDRWQIGERFTATAGARYTYVGFLPDSHHADAVVQVELRGDAQTVVRGSVAARTLTPGGDLLTLSTVAASPSITWARLEEGLRPARVLHYEFGVDRALGATRVGASFFDETTHDTLLTVFEAGAPYVRNAGSLEARGFGVTVGRRFGHLVDGSVTYTFGHGRRSGSAPFVLGAPATAFEESEFHDLAAKLETFIDWSDTRVAALCRLNALSDTGGSAGAVSGRNTATSTRFDVQLTQGLPFLAPLTRADWEVLLAVRNMFYEASQAGFLDELAVQDPPTRVVGGISVRF
jgi:hypothetical protein